MIDSESTTQRIAVTNISDRLTHICGSVILSPGGSAEVPMDFVTQYGGNADLRFDWSRYSDMMASRTEDGRPMFDFWCPLSAVDGYGRHALDIWRGMKELGAVPKLRASRFVDRSFLDASVDAERYLNMYEPPCKVGLAMSIPYDPIHNDHQSVSRVSITQFETDRIPEYHIRVVNRNHHLIVTSGFQPQVWRKSGCAVPISVLTPGIDTEFFSYTERERSPHFRVLMIGALTGRKNPVGAIRIFQAASQGSPDWRLTLKTRYAAAFEAAQKAALNDPRIEFIIGDSPPEHVRWLYQNHDCLLWPSKGEGVGLPPLEAMATGMECVVSDNSGMSDYADSDICYPIKTDHMEPAASYALEQIYGIKGLGFSNDYLMAYGDVGNWWVPSEAHATDQLRRCYDNWSRGKGKGRNAAEYVRTKHNLRVQAQSVLKVLERYLDD